VINRRNHYSCHLDPSWTFPFHVWHLADAIWNPMIFSPINELISSAREALLKNLFISFELETV